MEKCFQVWPNFQNMIFLFQLYDTLYEQYRPCRHTSEVGYVNLCCFTRHFFNFLLPVTHQRNLQARSANELRPWWKILHDHSRYVSVKRRCARIVLVNLMAPPYG